MTQRCEDPILRTHPGRPFVGYAGSGNTLCIEQSQDTIRCRTDRSTLWILRLGMALFGPGLSLLWAWLTWGPAARELPWPIAGVLLLATLAAWWFLFRSVVYEHRVELSIPRRQLCFYRRRRGRPVLRLEADEVVALRRAVAWYRPDDGPAVANHVLQLVVTPRGGVACTLSLCASPDAAMIEAFEARLATLLEAEVERHRSD